MIIRMFIMNKRTKKSRSLIEVVNTIGDKDEFFEKMKEFEETMKDDEEFLNKGRVIKLWGYAFHNEFLDFENTLDSINIDKLMSQGKNGSVSITENEDAFFYLYLGIPNILEKDEMPLYRRKLKEKMDAYMDLLKDQLVQVLGNEVNKFYEKEDDQGLAFYEELLAGNYAQYQYSKSLIGIYKSIANATAAYLYKQQGNQEKYDECMPMLENFNKSGIGERWIKQLGLEVKEEVEEETFEVSNEEEKKEDTEE